MQRLYHHQTNHIEFESILVDQTTDTTYKQSVNLYPLKKIGYVPIL
jgi:hypothetical protein